MKKRAIILFLAGLLILGGGITVSLIKGQNLQREWPRNQLRNAVTLGAALEKYQDQHGSYPSRLQELVAGGMIDQQGFDDLLFRAGPKAEPEQWLYMPPQQISDIAIVAPTVMFPWDGHSGYTAIAQASGGGELVPSSKRSKLPAWALK